MNASYSYISHEFVQDMICAASDEAYCIHNWWNHWIIQKGELTSDNVTNLGSKMNFWGTAYASIRSINIFFDRIEESPVEASIKDRMIGEMKFIRSFVYANLIWRYGGVPIFTNVFDLNQDYTVSRDS